MTRESHEERKEARKAADTARKQQQALERKSK